MLSKAWLRGIIPRPVWEAARIAYWRSRTRGFSPYWVRHLYSSVSLELLITDPVAQSWYDHDWAEQEELTLLGRLASDRGEAGLSHGARVFDLGAHQGLVACLLADRVGKNGSVLALEASGRNCEIARQNVLKNGYSQIQVLHSAIAATDGTVAFSETLNGEISVSGAGANEVPATSLSTLIARYGHPDVIFLDVEGYEAMILPSISAWIESAKTDWMIEIHSARDRERFGHPPRNILSPFFCGAFDCFVKREGAKGFEPWTGSQAPEFNERFFLIATWRKQQRSTTEVHHCKD